jgi:hypothetical protein
MTIRRVVPVALIAALLVAFGLGSMSAAAGGALTKKSVKKIAAKVVAKKAPTLSVAHAATAGDAATLGGLTAGQLKTTAYTYTLPVQADAVQRRYTFPGLPAGTYQISYSFIGQMTVVGATVICHLHPNGGSSTDPQAIGTFGTGAPGFTIARTNAAGVATVTPGATLFCGASNGSFHLDDAVYSDNVVSFVRVDSSVAGVATGS